MGYGSVLLRLVGVQSQSPNQRLPYKLVDRFEYYFLLSFVSFANVRHKNGISTKKYFQDHLAGHHCSWCFDAEGIRLKLISAQADDKPRWGDYPDKLELPYLEGLIQNGEWFDGTKAWTFIFQQQHC